MVKSYFSSPKSITVHFLNVISMSIVNILDDKQLETVYQKKKEYAYFDRILSILINYFNNNNPFPVEIYNGTNIQFCLLLLSIRPEYDFNYLNCVKKDEIIDPIKFFQSVIKVVNSELENVKNNNMNNKDMIIKLIHLVDISLSHFNDKGFTQLSKQKMVFHIYIYIFVFIFILFQIELHIKLLGIFDII